MIKHTLPGSLCLFEGEFASRISCMSRHIQSAMYTVENELVDQCSVDQAQQGERCMLWVQP